MLVGAVVFWLGEAADALVRANPGQPAAFNPFVYSLDAFLPIVDLGQEKRWAISPDDPSRWAMHGYTTFHVIVGWLLATLGLAAVTGLVRRD